VAKNNLTAEEIIAEIRSIAEAMTVRGFRPGHISKSLKYRIRNFTLKTGMPLFGLWASHRKYKTEPGIVIFNGHPVTMQMIKTDDTHVDDTVGEICQEIAECLMVVDWKQLVDSEGVEIFRGWTPEIAEAAICKAAEQLPVLCDQLESAIGIKSQKKVRKTYANGTHKKNSAKNNHAWDANARRMATRYIAACKREGRRLNRPDFIAEELACNADDFPNAREASTINQSLKIHSAKWKPRLNKALGRTTEAE